VGAVALGAGLVLGVTGALLAFRNAWRPSPAGVSATAGLARLDAIVARVAMAAPGARIAAVSAEADDVIRVDVRSATGTPETLRLGRANAAAVAVAPATPWDLVRRLHAGEFPGWLVRAVYAAFGLALAVLAMTGFVMAARRQSSKVLT
jgi:uncharacterized iron-regulated membrane protein